MSNEGKYLERLVTYNDEKINLILMLYPHGDRYRDRDLVLFGKVVGYLSVKCMYLPPQYDGGEWNFILRPTMTCKIQYVVQVIVLLRLSNKVSFNKQCAGHSEQSRISISGLVLARLLTSCDETK